MKTQRYETSRFGRLSLAVVVVLMVPVFAGCPNYDDDPDADVEADTSRDVADDTDADTTVEADLDLPGLSAPATARFDESGVLHLECETLEDCVTAQGYYHADDRFFEMDLVRRQTRGKLSTLIGLNFGISSDKRFRQLMSTRKGERLAAAYWDEMNDETKAMLRAYTRGVNAWLDDMRNDENGASLTEEYDHFLLSDDIPDWKPEDSIAMYLQLAYQLSYTADRDLFRAEMIDTLGADVAKDLFTVKTGPTSNVYQAAGVTNPASLPDDGPETADALEWIHENRLEPASGAIRSARNSLDRTTSLIFGDKSPRDGSNNWAVRPGQTKDGNALLANDPHLTLNNPAIWYYNELHVTGSSEGIHVAGASIPATPGVVVGHNEKVAWGVTTAKLDLSDAYVETLTADGEAVRRNGNEISIVTKTITFEGKEGDTQEATMEWVPGHGPIVSKDESNNRAVTYKWVAQNPGPDFNFLLPLMRADTVQQAMDAMAPVETICQNWVFADTKGSIGWYPKGAIPKRPWASPQTPNWLPLPGDGSAEWQGFVSEQNAPKMKNPPKGYLATANNDFDGSYEDGDPTDDGHTPWQSPPTSSYRHKRIVERLDADAGSHSTETMAAIQADTHSLHGETVTPEILAAADQASSLTGPAQTVVSALQGWNYDCPTGLDGTDPRDASAGPDSSEAVGCAAFHVAVVELTEAIFDDELEPASDVSASSHWEQLQVALRYVMASPSELIRGDAYFDDQTTGDTETRPEIVASALDAAGKRLDELFGSTDSSKWIWGRTHTVTLASLFSPRIEQWDEGPWANDGGFATVDVAEPTGEEFAHGRGASIRVVFELGSDGVDGEFQLPGGQDHHRDSKYYLSLMDEWLRNEYRTLHFTPSEVKEAAEKTATIAPE